MRILKYKLLKTLEKKLNIEIVRPKTDIQLTVNEAVNLEKKVIFIAVPKTGTTTVRAQTSQAGTPLIKNPHLNILQVRELIYVYLLAKSLGSNMGFPNENPVFDADVKKEANDIFESFFKFSAVRNPWARTVSLYFRREGLQLNEKMDFGKFCEYHMYASDTCYYPTLHKNQYDWLCNEEGKMLMDYVYKVENFHTAINEINELTEGKVILFNEKRNHNPISKSSDYRNMYNDKTRKIIAERFEKDIDFFKYTF